MSKATTGIIYLPSRGSAKMSKVTAEMRFFMKTEELKKNLMKRGYTKQQALESIKKAIASELPEDMMVGIENDHICIRRANPANIGQTMIKAFGSSENAIKMMENLKKGLNNAVGTQEGDNND